MLHQIVPLRRKNIPSWNGFFQDVHHRDLNFQPCGHVTNLERVNVTFSLPVMSCSVMGTSVCVCRREEEDAGDPICLFCPPDVSESRLRDLAGGGRHRRDLNSSHLHPGLMNTNTPRRSKISRSFPLFKIKATAARDGCMK